MNHFRLEEKQNKTSKAKKFPCSAASDSLVVPPRLIFHVKSSKTINPSSTNFFLHTHTLSLSLSLSLCVSQNSHTLCLSFLAPIVSFFLLWRRAITSSPASPKLSSPGRSLSPPPIFSASFAPRTPSDRRSRTSIWSSNAASRLRRKMVLA